MTVLLVLAAFAGGMAFHHYAFHKVEEKAADVYQKLKGLF